MKKRLSLSVLLIVLLALFTSCVSTVAVSSWVPSQMDLTGYKTVGVMSTGENPYNLAFMDYQYLPVRVATSETVTIPREVLNVNPSFKGSAASTAAKIATSIVEASFNPDVYTVRNAETTDSIVSYAKNNLVGKTVRQELLDNGIDLLVTSSIKNQIFEEYVLAQKTRVEGKEVMGYFICQRASLTLEYNLQNVKTAEIVGTATCSGSYPSDSDGIFTSNPVYVMTLIGYSKKDGSEYTPVEYFINPNIDFMYEEIVKSFLDEITLQVSPRLDDFYFSMLMDKTKSEKMKEANNLVAAGNIKQAYDIYSSIYKELGMFEAGYNATILMFTMGDRATALDMASELWKSSYNKKAQTLYNRLKKLTDTQDKALSQITGTVQKTTDKELIGF